MSCGIRIASHCRACHMCRGAGGCVGLAGVCWCLLAAGHPRVEPQQQQAGFNGWRYTSQAQAATEE